MQNVKVIIWGLGAMGGGMKHSLIKRQIRGAKELTDADIDYLAQEVRADRAYVRKAIAEIREAGK